MIDWNILVSQIATVAFDIVYFGAIISTIVVIILDTQSGEDYGMDTHMTFPPNCRSCFLFLLWSESASGTYHRSKKVITAF